MKNIIRFAKKLKPFLYLSIVLNCFMSSCSNKLETVQSIQAIDTIPTLFSRNFYLQRSEQGKITLTAKAPIVKYLIQKSDTFIIFPEGIEVQTFSNYPIVESMITARYAKHYQSSKMWEVKNNVVARNYKGDTLYTELLYWDEKNKKIFSNKLSRIITSDGLLIGRNGFEADESLTKWKVINTQGTVNVKDE